MSAQQDVPPQSAVILPTLWSGPWIWREQRAVFAAAAPNVLEIEDAVVNWPIDGTLDAAEAHCLAMMADLPAPMVLAGASLGGLLALRLGLHRPDLVSRVIACGCPGLGANDELGRGLGGRFTLTFDEAKAARAALFQDPSRVSDEELRATVAAVANRQGVRRGARLVRALRRYDVSADLLQLTVPTTLIWGEADQLAPLAPWLPLVEACASLHLRVIADTGHVPMLESPRAFNEILSEILPARGR
ncbi:MAG TPA: alpha/beta hydrolase [Steroidobacteraceae bacterium]|nr:alpha/beta hydrolase [Steroidobacteraceae bacterium]